MREPPSAEAGDEELLVLLRQSEARERMLRTLEEAEDDAEEEPEGDACPHCGEAALALADCDVCGEDGCLPRDDWRPGWADPCLTRCSRCGVLFHVDCGGRGHDGNPLCGTCGGR